jgi:hypothetical protein
LEARPPLRAPKGALVAKIVWVQQMTFETELLTALEQSGDSFVSTRRCFHYDFDGYPVRLWHGQGKLITSGGVEWLGTIDAAGEDHHTAPPIRDPRDGASPTYEFGIPFVSREAFDALKADQSKARDRDLTVYRVIVHPGEGMRPQTPIAFANRLVMRGVRFEKSLVEQQAGQWVENYAAFVSCRTVEYGRSRFPGGTYTDTSQNERAALLGVSSDSGCVFVAGNANRTYVFD